MRISLILTSVFSVYFTSAIASANEKCDATLKECVAKHNCDSIGAYLVDGKPTIYPGAIDLVKLRLDKIMATALKNKVDPRTLIGAILVANTIHRPTLLENEMNWREHKFGGLGYITEFQAMDVEYSGYPKKWDPSRTQKKRDDVVAELGNDDQALQRTGEYLRYTQEIYARHNVPIDENPEYLSSLYFMRNIEGHATKAEKAGGVLNVNQWGVMVVCNEDVIKQILATAKDSKAASVEGTQVFLPRESKFAKDYKWILKTDGTVELNPGTGSSSGPAAAPLPRDGSAK